MMKKEIKFAKYTNEGGRKVNEDSIGVFQNDTLLCAVLCDGLGGHGMGDMASQTAVKAFENIMQEEENPESVLVKGFETAQSDILAAQIENNAKSKMKTTSVAAVIDKHKVFIGHVGDSRAYVFKGNKVKIRTRDHSVPQMLVAAGEIKECEIRNHPDRNKVLRVLGVEWEKKMYETMKPISNWRADAILLCSDGFWELIEEEEMCRLLKKSKTPEEWLQEMAKVVNKNGVGKNMDNNSAIAVWL